MTWADDRTAAGRFNVWESESSDGGLTWTNEKRISDAATGAPYKNAKGFLFLYGDYQDVAITGAGKTVAIFPEAWSYDGPGNTWYNR